MKGLAPESLVEKRLKRNFYFDHKNHFCRDISKIFNTTKSSEIIQTYLLFRFIFNENFSAFVLLCQFPFI